MDKSKVAQGVFWGGLGSAFSIGLKFISIPILARLLSPDEFGVVAVALAIMGFLVMGFGKGGMGSAILYYENSNPGQYIHTVFWANLLIGLLLALLCHSCAGLLANLIGLPESISYIEAISYLIPLLLVEQVGRSILLLDMKYKKLAGVMLVASLFGSFTALSMAYCGAGAWSLIGQQIAYQVILMSGFIYMSKYIPKMQFSSDRFAEIIPFVLRNTAVDILSWFSSQGVVLFVGRFFGASAVGGYSVSNRLSQLPREVVGNALDQAVFSGVANSQKNLDKNRALKDKLEHLWDDLLLVTKINAYFLGGGYIFLAIYAKTVVFIVLGESFVEFWPVFRCMAVIGFLGTLLNPVTPFLKGMGEDKLMLRLALCRAGLTLLAVFIAIEVGDGIVFVAYSMIVVQFIMLLIIALTFCSSVDNGFILIIAEFKGVFLLLLALFLLSWPVNLYVAGYMESTIWSDIVSAIVLLFITILLFPLLAMKDFVTFNEWLKLKLSKLFYGFYRDY